MSMTYLRTGIIEEFFDAICPAREHYYIKKEKHKLQLDAQSIGKQ